MQWWFTAAEHEIKIVLLAKLDDQDRILTEQGRRPVHCSHQGTVSAEISASSFAGPRLPTREGTLSSVFQSWNMYLPEHVWV